MYNGIGLQTARGSGTNGYVQRNLSFVKQIKNKIDYKSEDDFKRLERELNRVPNKDILDHQNKRQVELKCLQMQELMEQQGYTEEEIEIKVKEKREQLIHELATKVIPTKEWLLNPSPKDVKETHKMAEMNHKKNDNLKNALGISQHFIEGSSLDATRKAKEAMAAEAMQKRYDLLKEPSPDPVIKNIEEMKSKDKTKRLRKNESNRKHSSRKHSSESESESDSDSYSSDERSKRRRKKRSNDKKSKDRKRHKTSDNKKSQKRYKKYSDSESSGSESDSDSDSDSSSDSGSESTGSSDSSVHKSRNDRKNKDNRKESRRHSPVEDIPRKSSKPYAELKGSTEDNPNNNNSLSHSIEANLRQMRREAETTGALDKVRSDRNDRNDQKVKDNNKETKGMAEKAELMPPRRQYPSRSRSRSSSRSSDEPKVKRLKSTVFETNASKKAKEVPKSYSTDYEHKRSDSRTKRSLSPEEKSRQSSRSYRSRSNSLHSNDSRSSGQSSRSFSSSKSSSSSSGARTHSRSPSIPRHKGSPSFLDKRRITRY